MSPDTGAGAEGRLFDPGLQPERTELAWRRTLLALAVGSLISDRVLAPLIGVWALAVTLAGLGTTIVCWVLASTRARRVQQVLLRQDGPLPGAALLLAVAAAVVAAAVLALVYVGGRHLAGQPR